MARTSYVVLGATGHIGSVITSRLLDAGARVRVVARTADRLAPFVARGAEAAAGSVEDAPFLREALDGADAAFLMLPPFFGEGIRAWQDRTAGVICDAVHAARVPRVVVLSSIGADLSEGNGPVAGLHTMERRLDAIAGCSSLRLRPGYFFENSLGAIGIIRATGAVGLALRPELKMAQIATRDIGEVAARRLLALDWKGHAIQELHGERDLTMVELTGALGRAIGRPGLRYVQLPYADAQQGLVGAGIPEEAAALYMEMSKGFNEGRVRHTQPRSPATTTPTSIERWAADVFAPVFAASAPRTEAAEEARGHA